MNALTIFAIIGAAATLFVTTKGDDILNKLSSYAKESFSFQVLRGRIHSFNRVNGTMDLRFDLNITNLSAVKLTVSSIYADIYILDTSLSSPAKVGDFSINSGFTIEPNSTKNLPEAKVNTSTENVLRNILRLLRSPRTFKAIVTITTANGKQITLNQTFEA